MASEKETSLKGGGFPSNLENANAAKRHEEMYQSPTEKPTTWRHERNPCREMSRNLKNILCHSRGMSKFRRQKCNATVLPF
jgi:hypothetical protein